MSHAKKQFPVYAPVAPAVHLATPASARAPLPPNVESAAALLTTVVTHEDIAQRAHDIYVKNGFRQGQSNQNWEQAERDLRDHGKVACHAEHRIQAVFAPDSVTHHRVSQRGTARKSTPFSKKANAFMKSNITKPQGSQDGVHFLVVIDHRQARVYKSEMSGTVPQSILPHDPHGFGRSLHYNQDDSNGQRKPELKSFYEAVAKTLQGADQILIFGAGTGASSAMSQLLLDLQHNHHDLAERVVGTLTIDEQHLSENQLLAKAREFYSAPAPASP